MRRRFLTALGLGTALAFGGTWLAGIPLVAAGDPCYHSFEMPATTTGQETQIKVAPCAFVPTVTHVAVGSTVKFVNGPDFVHLVTGANQAWGSRDATLDPGKSVSYQFDAAGIYPYACALHRGMSGAIVVEEAAAAVGAPTNADIALAETGASATEPVAADQPAGSLGIVVASATLGALVALAAVMLVRRSRRGSPLTRPEAADLGTAG